MSAWLKAGLIGAAVLVVLNLLGLIPCVGCIAFILGFLAYAGIGALAAYYLPPVREVGTGAGQGALAAVLAALIGGLVNAIVITIQTAVTDSAAIFSQLPAESMQQLRDAGIDPVTMGPAFGLLGGSLCCVAGLIIAAILGAIGGAIFAAVKPE